MAIVVNKRPYARNWSGNPIAYELYSAAAEADSSIDFDVQVKFKYPGGAITSLVTLVYKPYLGTSVINIQNIIDGKLSYGLPPLTGTETDNYTADKQTGYFFITFRQSNETAWNESEVDFLRLAIKGGISYTKWRGDNYWTFSDTNKPFLTWQVNGRQAAPDERMYLAWLNQTDAANPAIKYRVVSTFTDGTVRTNWFNITSVIKNTVVHFPVGAIQLGLPDLEPAKNLWYWEVTMQDHTDAGSPANVSETFKYYADNRNQYNDKVINYRNSLGGVDSAMIRGVIESQLKYDSDKLDTVIPPDYFTGSKTSARSAVFNNRETVIYKGDIGYMPKEDQQRLRDAHLNREAWMEIGLQWLPVINVTGDFTLTASDDQLWRMPFEWILGGPENFYTPDAVDIGDADAGTNICAGTVSDLAVSFPDAPGSYTTIEFNATITGASQFTYQVAGFHPSPITANVSDLPVTITGLTASLNYSIELRALCANGATGKPERKGFTTAAATYDSGIYNYTDHWDTWKVYVDTTEVENVNLNTGEYDFFNCGASGVHDIKVTYLNGIPSVAKLICAAGTYFGTVGAVEATWDDIDITGGFTIEMY